MVIVHYDIQPLTYLNVFSVGGASREKKPVANSGRAGNANASSEGQSSVLQKNTCITYCGVNFSYIRCSH